MLLPLLQERVTANLIIVLIAVVVVAAKFVYDQYVTNGGYILSFLSLWCLEQHIGNDVCLDLVHGK